MIKGQTAKEALRTMAETFPLIVVVHAAEDDGFWIESPQLGGCFAEGATVGKALHNYKFAIFDYFDIPKRYQKTEAFRIEAVDLPEPSSSKKPESVRFISSPELALSFS